MNSQTIMQINQLIYQLVDIQEHENTHLIHLLGLCPRLAESVSGMAESFVKFQDTSAPVAPYLPSNELENVVSSIQRLLNRVEELGEVIRDFAVTDTDKNKLVMQIIRMYTDNE